LISKSQIKSITALGQKKYRQTAGLFVAEGPKVIAELIDSGLKLHSVYSISSLKIASEKLELISASELKKISFLKTPNEALAVFEIPSEEEQINPKLTLVLDSVRDPGNLGTIIRMCDWFGVEKVICSTDTVDCYNPKVVQATMGSIARVAVVYTNILEILKDTSLPIYGAFMEGTNVYSKTLPEDAFLVMGNEANGVSSAIESLISEKISIPQFGKSHNTESLNVATATAILLSEFKRII